MKTSITRLTHTKVLLKRSGVRVSLSSLQKLQSVRTELLSLLCEWKDLLAAELFPIHHLLSYIHEGVLSPLDLWLSIGSLRWTNPFLQPESRSPSVHTKMMAWGNSNEKRFRLPKLVPSDLYTGGSRVEALRHYQYESTGQGLSYPRTGSGLSSISRTTALSERTPFGQVLVQNSKEQRFEGRNMASHFNFMIPSFSEPLGFGTGIDLYSPKYFLTCTVGGMICCSIPHLSMTPVDVVKCNMQIDSKKYKTIRAGFRTTITEQGIARGLFRGWAPTFWGYSVQGAGKYGFYELFKHLYSEAAGAENSHKYKTLIYLAASASGEFLADIGLAPFEAVKVRVQTQPGFAKGMVDGLPKIVAQEGVIGGLYKGIVPLWGRQVPYTMMKFATFENTVEALYKHVVPMPKEKCSPAVQLGVTVTAGYIAGVACAIISHPADNLVSFLNNSQGATVSQAFKEMGIKALLTRGLPLRILMIGPLTAAQWGIYDSFKVFVGLPTSGGGGAAVHLEDDVAPKNT